MLSNFSLATLQTLDGLSGLQFLKHVPKEQVNVRKFNYYD